jgi:Ca-activated chloride channel family protein
MKTMFRAMMIVAVVLFSLIPVSLPAQPVETADKTLSPYFFIQSDDPEIDQLPLKSTSADVDISGVIADVVVTQVYENQGKRPLEALYVFPASTRAAVYAMKMTIGERTIIAKIKEKEAARQDYEQAKKEGKSASLLEQHRPNVFQMNVANILPGDVITVELKYTELLVPTDKIYEFVYPTVVGPRYVSDSGDNSSGESWTQNPYLSEGKPPTYRFDIRVDLKTGLPVKDIACATHQTITNYHRSDAATVTLDPGETSGGNRDFILKYRLAGNQIDGGLILSKGDKENFFLMMVQPPKRVDTEEIPPREYIFIVDVSGSMHGFPLDISKQLLTDLIGNLRPSDSFNVLLFAGGSSMLSEQSLPATKENIQKAIQVIENQRGGGGTQILPALQKALSLENDEGVSRTVVIATDGYVSVEARVFDLIRQRLKDANMFAFGIGSSVNRHLIEGMARVGMGEPFVITKPREAPAMAEKFRKLIQTPVLTDISVEFEDFDAFEVEPPSIPDLLAERPVILFGKWKGNASGSIHVTGRTGNGLFEKRIQVSKPEGSQSALQNLWARHRIAVLADYQNLSPSDTRKKEVIRLGLAYSLLTAYTSFVAIDTQVRTDGETTVTVKQPLPLPQGVSNYAVGHTSARKGFSRMPAPLAYQSNLPGSPRKALKESETLEGTAGNITQKNEGDAREEVMKQPGHDKATIFERVECSGWKDSKKIKSLLTANEDKIIACIGKQSIFSGKVILFHMVIDKSGRLLSIQVIGNKPENKSLEECLKNSFSKVVFPVPDDTSRGVIKVTIRTP